MNDAPEERLAALRGPNGAMTRVHSTSARILRTGGRPWPPARRAAVIGTVALVAAALGIVGPQAAGAAPVAAAVYVANDVGGNVLSYPTTANGDVTPTASMEPTSPTPYGTTFDAAGDLWAANEDGTLVEYTPAQLATSGSPTPAVTIAPSNESLDSPEFLAFDASGDLWVAEGAGTLVEYTASQLATSGAPTPAVTISATANSLDTPVGLAFGPSGDLWVANSATDTLVDYTPSQLATSGAPTPAVTISATANSLDTPLGLAFGPSGDLWVANDGDSSLLEFTPSQLTTGAPTPAVTISATANSLYYPVGLAFGPSGDLWVANDGGNTLTEFTPSQLTTGAPTPAVTVSASANSLNAPYGLAFGASGDLWVANNGGSTLTEYTPGDLAATGAPVPAVTLSAENGFYDPEALAFDSSGDLWVPNHEGNNLTEYTPGQLGTGSPSPNVVLSSAGSSLSSPFALAFGPSGDLWVSNQNNTVVEYTAGQLTASGSPTPAVTITSSAGSINDPRALAFDPSGDLWVANSWPAMTVVEYTAAQLAQGGALTPAVTITSPAQNSLDSPMGLAFGPSGDLWVSNYDNNSLVEYTLGQLAQGGPVTPAVTISSTAAGSLDHPGGLAFDSSGDLWVSNFGNNSLVEFAPGQLTTGAPVPVATVSGSTTGLEGPLGIAIEAAPAAPGGVSASAGDAQVNVSWAPVTGAASYEVFEATSPGAEDYPGAPACTTGLTATACTVGALANGTQYYFTVEALGGGGASAPSAEVSATPQAPVAPSTTTTTTTTTTSATTSTSTTSTTSPAARGSTVATTTALHSSDNPVAVGRPVTYTAAVSPAPGGGTASFAVDGTVAAACGAVALGPTGRASCSFTYTSAGTHSVVASFSGSGAYSASVSAALSETVADPGFPGAGTSYPDGALLRFSGAAYVLAGGRAFAASASRLTALERVDHAQVLAAPAGATAPTKAVPRSGTLLTTRAVTGAPTMYVVGPGGELYGFARPAQFLGGGFDPALVVTVPSLGGLPVSAESAGAAGVTAASTAADGALVDSRGTFYVFAGGRAFGIASPAALAAVERADRAQVLAGAVGAAQASGPIASGVLLSLAEGHGVFVSYGGQAYLFKTEAQLKAGGYGGTAAVPVPGTGHLDVVLTYSGG
jgi:sugar lactone lactonase YvrE